MPILGNLDLKKIIHIVLQSYTIIAVDVGYLVRSIIYFGIGMMMRSKRLAINTENILYVN